MRGSPNKFKIFYPVLRIIPTGAGLTDAPQLDTKAFGDHPRGCGAHVSYRTCLYRQMGSSPRVRGSRAVRLSPSVARGIIPAGAGLTVFGYPHYHGYRDHPRGCGAHRTRASRGREASGSSPRVRGSPARGGSSYCAVGIIPAGAGLTLKNPNNYAIPYSFGSQNHSLLSILTGYLILFIRLSQLRLNTLSVFAMTFQTPATLTYRKGTAEAVPFYRWLPVAIRSCS